MKISFGYTMLKIVNGFIIIYIFTEVKNIFYVKLDF